MLPKVKLVTEITTTKEHINASEIDPKFKYELSEMHGGEKLLRCSQCGTCTPNFLEARRSNTYRLRQIIRMAQLCLKELAFNDFRVNTSKIFKQVSEGVK